VNSVVQVRCVAEAVYRQDTVQIHDICGVTNIRDQRAVPRKVGAFVNKLSPRGAAKRYASRRWQFNSLRIYVRPRTGPQSAQLQAAKIN